MEIPAWFVTLLATVVSVGGLWAKLAAERKADRKAIYERLVGVEKAVERKADGAAMYTRIGDIDQRVALHDAEIKRSSEWRARNPETDAAAWRATMKGALDAITARLASIEDSVKAATAEGKSEHDALRRDIDSRIGGVEDRLTAIEQRMPRRWWRR